MALTARPMALIIILSGANLARCYPRERAKPVTERSRLMNRAEPYYQAILMY
jgi:hypothetical protein